MERKKNLKLGLLLVLCLLFQITIPILIMGNEKNTTSNGVKYRFNISEIVNDYDNGILYIKVETRPKGQTRITEGDGLTVKNRFNTSDIYEILTNNEGTSFLNPVLHVFIGESDYLNDNNLVFVTQEIPREFMSHDKIETLYTGAGNKTGDLKLEADVLILNESYIVTDVYVNGESYYEYVNSNFYKLLK